MSDLIAPAVSTPPPTTSQTTESWLLADHIDAEHLAALRAMAGLTVDPDVLHVNGNEHNLD